MHLEVSAYKFTAIKSMHDHGPFAIMLYAMEVCITNNEVIFIGWRLEICISDIVRHYVNFMDRRVRKQNMYDFAAYNSSIN